MADEEHDLERERREQDEEDRASRRYYEARQFGFSRVEAETFRDGDAEIGELRRLVEGGCPVATAVRILRPLSDTTDLVEV